MAEAVDPAISFWDRAFLDLHCFLQFLRRRLLPHAVLGYSYPEGKPIATLVRSRGPSYGAFFMKKPPFLLEEKVFNNSKTIRYQFPNIALLL